ncbi:hypothetical protein FRC18_001109 [Serendipita sp. 400]|nr:hypothetical protein FRC18_001109 [Serendipita sp. 400]
MSAMVLDKSLDAIIAEKKSGRRKPQPRRSNPKSAKSQLLGKGGLPAVQAKRRAGAGATGPAPAATAATSSGASLALKIIVSNLPTDVNEAQIKDLFNSTVGPTKSCVLQYNASGKSSGTATVIFQKPGGAQKAFESYNNRLIDGKRPMKIEIVVDPAKQPLANRVAAAAPAPASATVAAAGSGGGATRNPARRGRGRGRGAGAGPAGAGRRPKKTLEDLDAEMADYTKEGTTTATA